MLRAEGQALVLSREMTIGPTDKWLAVHVGLPTGEDPRPDTIALHVGEQQVQPRKIPMRQRWQSGPVPFLFPLGQYQGKKVALELRQPAGGSPLHWQGVRTSGAPPAAYRLAEILALAGKRDVQVPYALGQALQSDRISRREKLAALEITQLGGHVNFTSRPAGKGPLDGLASVMIGSDWTGGDKALLTLRELPDSITLLVAEDSGVSSGAIDKLQTAMPKLAIRTLKRTPSSRAGEKCFVTWRNHCPEEVVVLWIDELAAVHFSRHLKPGQEMRRDARCRQRYEAHILRKDYAEAEEYTHTKALSRFLVTPDAVWDIKPPAP